jgi:hypothetical protein
MQFFRNNSTGKQEKFEELVVNERSIVFLDRTISIANISRLTSYTIYMSNFLRFLGLFFAYIFMEIFIFYESLYKEHNLYLLFLSIISFSFFIFAFVYKWYGVQIQTNGGTNDILITNNESSALQLHESIRYSIDNVESGKKIIIKSFNNTVKITQRNEVRGDMVMGDSYREIDELIVNNLS